MSENPSELQRFYAETVEPLVAYDEQYETDLVRTLETFLEADGNVAGTAQRLFTHRHTIYYRLERVRELSGLDVSSSDGREKLSLGLKAMRVLGITSAGGPASEAGAEGGRVPRRPGSRRPWPRAPSATDAGGRTRSRRSPPAQSAGRRSGRARRGVTRHAGVAVFAVEDDLAVWRGGHPASTTTGRASRQRPVPQRDVLADRTRPPARAG